MALKNISIIDGKNEPAGSSRFRLIDNEGDFIEAFDHYTNCLINHGFGYSTKKRYSFAAAKFVDYLYELGVLGKPALKNFNYPNK